MPSSRSLSVEHVDTCCLCVLAMVGVGFLLVTLRGVLVPFVMALLVVYTLTPIVDLVTRPVEVSALPPLLRRFHVRMQRGPAVILALLLAVVGITIAGAIVAGFIDEVGDHAEKYSERFNEGLELSLTVFNALGVDIKSPALRGKVFQQSGDIVLRIVSIAVDELYSGFLTLLFVVYLLGGYDPHKQISGVREQIDRQVKKYIALKALISMLTGVSVGLSLAVLSVDFSMLFGLLSFLLNFIPNIGSIIATLLPLFLVALDPEKTWLDVILVVAVPGGLQMLVGNVLEPKMFGSSLDLHPVAVLLSLMLWGFLWGVNGAILSVPMTATFKICCEALDHPIFRACAQALGSTTATGPMTPTVTKAPFYENQDLESRSDPERENLL